MNTAEVFLRPSDGTKTSDLIDETLDFKAV